MSCKHTSLLVLVCLKLCVHAHPTPFFPTGLQKKRRRDHSNESEQYVYCIQTGFTSLQRARSVNTSYIALLFSSAVGSKLTSVLCWLTDLRRRES